MKKQDNTGNYNKMVDYFASCGLHKYEDIADEYRRAYVYPSLMALGKEVEEFDDDLKKANEKLNKEIEEEANRIKNQGIKVKEFNNGGDILEQELNEWLSKNTNNIKVIDIKYSVASFTESRSCDSEYFGCALVIYRNIDNDEMMF